MEVFQGDKPLNQPARVLGQQRQHVLSEVLGRCLPAGQARHAGVANPIRASSAAWHQLEACFMGGWRSRRPQRGRPSRAAFFLFSNAASVIISPP